MIGDWEVGLWTLKRRKGLECEGPSGLATNVEASWGPSGVWGPQLTPDGGCTIQPSSAVAVVESISVSVGRAKNHHFAFSVLSVTLP